jgi:hypothetical protein
MCQIAETPVAQGDQQPPALPQLMPVPVKQRRVR